MRERVPRPQAFARVQRLVKRIAVPHDAGTWVCPGYARANGPLLSLVDAPEPFQAGLAYAAHRALAEGVAWEATTNGDIHEGMVALLNAVHDLLIADGYCIEDGRFTVSPDRKGATHAA